MPSGVEQEANSMLSASFLQSIAERASEDLAGGRAGASSGTESIYEDDPRSARLFSTVHLADIFAEAGLDTSELDAEAVEILNDPHNLAPFRAGACGASVAAEVASTSFSTQGRESENPMLGMKGMINAMAGNAHSQGAPGHTATWHVTERRVDGSSARATHPMDALLDGARQGMESDKEEEDSLSEESVSDANSDDDDIFEMRPQAACDLSCEYKSMWLYRWSLARDELCTQLREEVLLPLDPEDAEKKAPFLDVQRGVVLPPWHCPFQGCSVAEKDPGACDKHESNLWQHIWAKKYGSNAHSASICRIVCKHGLKDGTANLQELAFTVFSMAMLEKERGGCPKLGLATDRRALGHVGEVF
jgi:hypothetical protein